MTAANDAQVACLSCGRPVPAVEVIRRVGGLIPATHSYTSRCPRCGHALEFAVRVNALHLGYTYWAGSLHFETTEVYRVPGLRETVSDAGPRLHLGDEVIHVPTAAG